MKIMKKSVGLLVAFIVASSLCSRVHAQQDTEFWFAVPYFVGGTGNAWHGWESRMLNIVTLDKAADVSIFKPAAYEDKTDPYYFEPINVHVEANSVYSVDLNRWIGALMLEQGKSRPFALQILSTSNIYAYFTNFGSNYDIYSLKGRNAIGTEFIVPMQYLYDTHAGWEKGEKARSSV